MLTQILSGRSGTRAIQSTEKRRTFLTFGETVEDTNLIFFFIFRRRSQAPLFANRLYIYQGSIASVSCLNGYFRRFAILATGLLQDGMLDAKRAQASSLHAEEEDKLHLY